MKRLLEIGLIAKGLRKNDTVADQYIDCIENGSNWTDAFIDFLKAY